MTEVHKSSRWTAQATPWVLFYFTSVPTGKSSVITTVCQVLPLTSKIPGNHFRGFHPLRMKERVEECLPLGAEVVQPPSLHSPHSCAWRPSPLPGTWRAPLLTHSNFLPYGHSGWWGMYPLALIAECVCAGLSLVPSSETLWTVLCCAVRCT